ncbi:MAG: NAD-dependent epimerase/dehydratase family protein [Myxococcota bacterium]
MKKTVVIAGASGFIGKHLSQALMDTHEVVGLSRSRASRPAEPGRIAWRRCDVLALDDVVRGLEGADVAVYLVHAMMPSSPLVHGGFEDIDWMAADNFARAAAQAGVSHIVYLGGLVPEERTLSPHLSSRLEVERVLGSHGVPVTSLRAGLVIGPWGSSTTIMLNLVRRLPLMICPAWTETLTQPVALSDVIALLQFAIEHPDIAGDSYDIGCPEVLTYRRLMEIASEMLGLERRMWSVPLFTPELSRLWVSMITGAPRELVEPLIQSLTCPMVARDRRIHEMAGVPGVPVANAIIRALDAEAIAPTIRPSAFRGHTSRQSQGCVVARLTLPKGRDAQWVAFEYLRRLPELTAGPIEVFNFNPHEIRFHVRGLASPLLVLSHDTEASNRERAVFRVQGGRLIRKGSGGTMEFRVVEEIGGPGVLATLYGEQPGVWWPFYVAFQQLLHVSVLDHFERHLEGQTVNPRRHLAA